MNIICILILPCTLYYAPVYIFWKCLQRLAALYDPTHPALRPGLLQLFRSTRSREGSNERELSISFDSASVSSYSSDFVEPTVAVSVRLNFFVLFLWYL